MDVGRWIGGVSTDNQAGRRVDCSWLLSPSRQALHSRLFGNIEGQKVVFFKTHWPGYIFFNWILASAKFNVLLFSLNSPAGNVLLPNEMQPN